MSTIVTRAGKGSALTWAEADANFTNLNTDKLEISGGLMTGALGIVLGSVSAPGLYLSGDTNTGIWSSGADILGITTGGVARMEVNATGLVNIGQTALTAQLGVQSGSSSRTAMIVKMAASQSADAFVVQNSGGGVRFQVSPVGNVAMMGAATSTTIGLNMGTGGERIDTTGTAYGVNLSLINALQGNSIGMSFIVESRCPSATGTVGTMIGVQGGVFANSSTAIVTTFYGFYVVDPVLTAGAAITTIYGLHVKPQKITGVTTAYGIYCAGTADNNYLANSLSIGNTAGNMPAGLTGPALVLANCTAIPTGNPTSGGTLYSEAGALKWRGSGGTVTTLGAA